MFLLTKHASSFILFLLHLTSSSPLTQLPMIYNLYYIEKQDLNSK